MTNPPARAPALLTVPVVISLVVVLNTSFTRTVPSLKCPSLRYASIVPGDEYTTHFFRRVVGVPAVSKEVLSQRTADYQNWIEAFARNHDIPIEWAEKGVRKEDYVQPWLRIRRVRPPGA
jgi:hypothetical protein